MKILNNRLYLVHLQIKHKKMSKKKKKILGTEEEQWKSFVHDLLRRKRTGKGYKIPKEYLEALADRLHSTAPTKEIIYNAISDLYELAYTKGYGRRINDAKKFKDLQEKHFLEEWNKEKDAIDDLIHAKSNQPK